MTNQVAQASTETRTQLLKQYQDNSYPLWKLILESTYLAGSTAFWMYLINITIQNHQGPLPTLLGFISAQFLIDFVSGLLHWACDTWGKFTTPIFGPTLIYSFRMHHVDPQDITLHNFIQTNAASSYPAPLFIASALLTDSGTFLSQCFNWMIIFTCFLGLLTNECHKWAHMVHSKPHFIIRFLQSSGLIISHEKHHVHHKGNFDSSYCIINGWMNPILDRIDFWRKVEGIITKLTGAIPREDDSFWREAKKGG